MLTDIFGNDVSLDSPSTRDDWDRMQLAFLAHSAATPTYLAAVLTAEPGFAMGHAVKGLFYMMLSRRELVQTAQEALTTAQAALRQAPVTAREQLFVTALGQCLNGQIRAARECMETVLRSHPQDALALKISHGLGFVVGDASGMRQSIETALPHYSEDHAAYGYVMGCYAFALEETGDYARAQQAGLKGLTFAKDDAWGLHAVAHVFDMTANAKAGLDWLSGREEAWSHCNNFRYHVWWHKALMHLDQGDVAQVLALYDTEIRKDKTDDYRDISNATSLLSRLELDGVDVGQRWEELADLSENRTQDGCLIFADLHYLMALVRDDRAKAVRDITARLAKDAQNRGTDLGQTMADPGLAAAAGLEAFGDANYESAFLNLSKARQNLQLAGGSHAQRDVFERLTIDSAIRGGFLNEAKGILKERCAKRDGAEDRYAAVRFEMIAKGLTDAKTLRSVAAE